MKTEFYMQEEGPEVQTEPEVPAEEESLGPTEEDPSEE